MLKVLTSIFLALFMMNLSVFSQASESYPRSFSGIYLGPNLSGFTGDYTANIEGESGKIRIRTQYGFFSKIYITRDYSIFTGLEFILNGALTKNDNASSATVSISYLAKTNLSTLSVPALFTYTPRMDYGLLIGPQFDYILSAEEPWNRSDAIRPDDYQENVIEKYNRVGLSLSIGGYYSFLNGTSIHLRYKQGISNMTKAEYGNAKAYSIEFFAAIAIFGK
jgi:hypothetical protein